MNKLIYIVMLLGISQLAYSQKIIVGDNLGNHTAIKDLNMSWKNINNLKPIDLLSGYADSILCIKNGIVKKQATAQFLPDLSDYLRMSIVPLQTITGPLSFSGSISFSAPVTFTTTTVVPFAKDISINGIDVGVGIGGQTSNIAIGYQALLNNYALKPADGRNNIAIGYQALLKNDINSVNNTANDNTAVGYNAGSAITKSNGTTILGSNSGTGITIGNTNTFIGYKTGNDIITGNSNTIIGANALASGDLSNNIVLSDGDGVVRLQIDASGTPSFSGLTSINPLATDASGKIISGTISDSTLKVADGTLNSVLDKVMRLKPRYYYWKTKSGMDTTSRQLGFFAQEVNTALGNEVAPRPDKTKHQQYYGIQDRALMAYLTKALQEQQEQIEALKQEILLLKNK